MNLTPTEQKLPLPENVEDDYTAPEDRWSDDKALAIVKKDFAAAENYLVQNHYQRWNNADRIYLAWTDQKYWEGTKIPRASPSVFVAYEQVEALMAIDMATIFSEDPWAEAVPRGFTTPEQARATRDFVLAQFRDAKGRSSYRRAKKSALIYGNGIIEAGWEQYQRSRHEYQREYRPIQQTFHHPVFGRLKVPTGRMKSIVHERSVEETVSRPFIRYLPLRDFYIDPNCQGPSVQEAGFAIKRSFMTVDELALLREVEGFTIPADDVLILMTHQKPVSQGDTGKTQAAAWRAEMWQPNIDQTASSGGRTIEVLNYWSKDRCVWVLNRDRTAYNGENDYRDSLGDPVLPFFNLFYTDVLDRFYGMSITDVVEWDQRLIASLLGARLDELALNLNPPKVKRRGSSSYSPSQLRRRPGAVAEFDVPKDDYYTEPVSNVTGQAFAEVQAAEIRTEKTTGVTDLAVLGVPSSGGNAAARTATGSNIQAQASGRRTIYTVENTEAEALEPLLSFLQGMNRDFLDPQVLLEFSGPDKAWRQMDPLQIMNSVVHFEMRAGSRARAQGKLQQVLPLILQTVFNPQLIAMAQQIGMTVDFEEIINIVADAADARPRGAWYRPMTPEEKQMTEQSKQPPPPDPTKLAMQRERLLSQGDHQDTQISADLIREIIRQQPKLQEGA